MSSGGGGGTSGGLWDNLSVCKGREGFFFRKGEHAQKRDPEHRGKKRLRQKLKLPWASGKRKRPTPVVGKGKGRGGRGGFRKVIPCDRFCSGEKEVVYREGRFVRRIPDLVGGRKLKCTSQQCAKKKRAPLD